MGIVYDINPEFVKMHLLMDPFHKLVAPFVARGAAMARTAQAKLQNYYILELRSRTLFELAKRIQGAASVSPATKKQAQRAASLRATVEDVVEDASMNSTTPPHLRRARLRATASAAQIIISPASSRGSSYRSGRSGRSGRSARGKRALDA